MSWSHDVWRILTLHCAEASTLASRELDDPLGLAERLALRGHLMVCRSCRTLRRQLQFLHEALQRKGAAHEANGADGETLSAAARARIDRVLAEAPDQGDGEP